MSKPNTADHDDYLAVLRVVREYEGRAAGWPALAWAFLSNTTVEPILPFVRRTTFDVGYRPDVWIGGFDTALQDASDPASGVYAPPADIVVVALRLHVLAPALVDRFVALSPANALAEASRARDYVCAVVDDIRRRSRALVLVHTFETPLYPELGILDAGRADGQVNIVRRTNLELAERLSAHPGVVLVDVDAVRARVGASRFTDARTWHIGRVAYTRHGMAALAGEYARAVRALRGRNRKAIVVDADNTLWGGIVGEDGVDGIQIGRAYPGSAFHAFQQTLLALRDRGVLLALCSKNDASAVEEVFARRAADMPLTLDDFAAVRVNWSDKAQNIREIAAELDLGLESFVFVDDSEFEVELVRELLPQVESVLLPPDPATYADMLSASGLFDTLAFSEEDKRRGDMYAAERQRRATRESSPLSVDEYLRGLGMAVQIASVDERSAARVAQLTQKTNQFNLTTRRYSDADVRGMAASADRDVLAVSLTDRFGDSGIVGVAILEHVAGRTAIDTLLLSCRVLGRGVEDALLIACLKVSALRGSQEIVGQYLPTAKNARVRDFFPSHGFTAVNGEGRFTRSLAGAADEPFPSHLESVTFNGRKAFA